MKYQRLPDLILLITGPALLLGGLLGHFAYKNIQMPGSSIMFVLGALAAAYFTARPGKVFSSKFSIYLLGAYFCLFSVFSITQLQLSDTTYIWIHTVFIFLATLSALQEARLMNAFDNRKNALLWTLVFIGFTVLTILSQPPEIATIAGALLCVSMRYTHLQETGFKLWIEAILAKIKARDFFLDNAVIAFLSAITFCIVSCFTTNEAFHLLAGLITCVGMMHIFDKRWLFALSAIVLLVCYGIPLP